MASHSAFFNFTFPRLRIELELASLDPPAIIESLSLPLETVTPTSFIFPALASEPLALERTGALGMSKRMLRRLVPEGNLDNDAGGDKGPSPEANATLDPESLMSNELRCFVMLATGTGMVSAVCGKGVPDLLLGVDDTGERWCSGRKSEEVSSAVMISDFRRLDEYSPEY
jgi:hypothetical protein